MHFCSITSTSPFNYPFDQQLLRFWHILAFSFPKPLSSKLLTNLWGLLSERLLPSEHVSSGGPRAYLLPVFLVQAGWRLLGDAAMQEGCFGLAEICFQKLKAFEKLSFLYLLLGDRTKLKKMLHVSKLLREPLLRQHQALLLGDAEERVDVFMEAQQPGLAYLCAKTHGLDELAEQLRGSVDEKDVEEFLPKNPVALFPPVPIMR